ARERAADGRRRRGVVGLVGGRNRRRQRRGGDVRGRRRRGRREGVVARLRAAQRQVARRDGLARADGGGVEAARAAAGHHVGADDAGQRAADGRGRRGVVRLVRRRDRRRQRRRGDVRRRRRRRRRQQVIGRLRAAEPEVGRRDGLAGADRGRVEAAGAHAGDGVAANHTAQRAADGRGRRGVVGLVARRDGGRQRRRRDAGRRRRRGRRQRVVTRLRAAEGQGGARDGLVGADSGRIEAAGATAGDDVVAPHTAQRAADGRGHRGVVGLVRRRDGRRERRRDDVRGRRRHGRRQRVVTRLDAAEREVARRDGLARAD